MTGARAGTVRGVPRGPALGAPLPFRVAVLAVRHDVVAGVVGDVGEWVLHHPVLVETGKQLRANS